VEFFCSPVSFFLEKKLLESLSVMRPDRWPREPIYPPPTSRDFPKGLSHEIEKGYSICGVDG
jgi:hypothetical protein